MIDPETKNKFIEELEKTGNILWSCRKNNIHRSTIYRWKKEDCEFRKLMNRAERLGRENNCDVAEQSLMLNIKDKKIDAIKYYLSHNSPRYKQGYKTTVRLEHVSSKNQATDQPKTDLVTEILKEAGLLNTQTAKKDTPD